MEGREDPGPASPSCAVPSPMMRVFIQGPRTVPDHELRVGRVISSGPETQNEVTAFWFPAHGCFLRLQCRPTSECSWGRNGASASGGVRTPSGGGPDSRPEGVWTTSGGGPDLCPEGVRTPSGRVPEAGPKRTRGEMSWGRGVERYRLQMAQVHFGSWGRGVQGSRGRGVQPAYRFRFRFVSLDGFRFRFRLDVAPAGRLRFRCAPNVPFSVDPFFIRFDLAVPIRLMATLRVSGPRPDEVRTPSGQRSGPRPDVVRTPSGRESGPLRTGSRPSPDGCPDLLRTGSFELSRLGLRARPNLVLQFTRGCVRAAPVQNTAGKPEEITRATLRSWAGAMRGP